MIKVQPSEPMKQPPPERGASPPLGGPQPDGDGHRLVYFSGGYQDYRYQIYRDTRGTTDSWYGSVERLGKQVCFRQYDAFHEAEPDLLSAIEEDIRRRHARHLRLLELRTEHEMAIARLQAQASGRTDVHDGLGGAA